MNRSRRLFCGGVSTRVEAVLREMNAEQIPTSSGFLSSWKIAKPSGMVHVAEADLFDAAPWTYLVIERDGDCEAIAGEISAQSGAGGGSTVYPLCSFDAVENYNRNRFDAYVEDGEGQVVQEVRPAAALRTAVMELGLCAVDDFDEDLFDILNELARKKGELQETALSAIGWSTWRKFEKTLSAVAANARAPKKARELAQAVLAERKASKWSVLRG